LLTSTEKGKEEGWRKDGGRMEEGREEEDEGEREEQEEGERKEGRKAGRQANYILNKYLSLSFKVLYIFVTFTTGISPKKNIT
jgi:hypothetical protein